MAMRIGFVMAFMVSDLWAASPLAAMPAVEPIHLHPDNPHYLVFRGKPTVLVSSNEHFGAILNLDFDYVKYLDTLQADRLNFTRTFSGGGYVEPAEGWVDIAKNTLGPAPGRFICPWARSGVPGYANGGNKFDLSRWDEAYFRRLKDFVVQAGRRGIVVELSLFCPFYLDLHWKLSPFHPGNNINGLGNVARGDVYTLGKHGGLLAVQEATVRKILTELKDCDNVFYEVMNEPYYLKVPMDWHDHMADLVAETENKLGVRHLISWNVANGKTKIQNPHPAVSIFNFHYASPPDTVTLNYGLGKVIGDNETGFEGNGDRHYRMEAWEFLLAGGALYNNLDYSFAVGHEDGTYRYPAKQPGGGNPGLRKQLGTLKRFFDGFDFVKMKPDNSVLQAGIPDQCRGTSIIGSHPTSSSRIRASVPDQCRAHALAEAGRQYAVYLNGGGQASLTLDLPQGVYRVEWLDPLTGKTTPRPTLRHGGGAVVLASPPFAEDVALAIRGEGR